MLIHHLLGDAIRVAVLLTLALLAMPLLRGASSATRRLVLALALGGALILPLVSAAAPSWHVQTRGAVASLRAVMVSEPLVSATVPAEASSPNEPTLVSSPRAETARSFDGTALAACVWAIGAALVLARLLVGLARTRGIVRRATRARAWSLAAARVAKATGRRVDVRATDDLDAPAVAGVLAPVILVPHASASWTDERRYAVLLHELAHVRQRDCFAQLVAQLACAAHWFNPLAWVTARPLRVERELAADDAVVAGGAVASIYAEDLLAIACSAGGMRDVPSGALGMAERTLLSDRVTAIVSARRFRRPPGPARAALLMAGVGAGVLAVACAAPEAVTATKADAVAATIPPAPSPGPRSTLDPRIQSIAEEELAHAVDQWKPVAGTVLVLDPSTGEILANAGLAHGVAADVGVRSVYPTGSTIKAFTLAAALEEGVLTPSDRFDCEHGAWSYHGRTIHDSHSRGMLTVPEMLALSSNIAFVKIFDRLGGDNLGRALRAFHFGMTPAIEGAVGGSVPERIEDHSMSGVGLAIGNTMMASPLQVAAAYGALANGGVYVEPTLTRRGGDAPRERVLREETAHTVVSLLEHVVSDEEATGTLARVEGQRVAGKTGTTDVGQADGSEHWYSSFVGIVPSTAPRYVILVGLEQLPNEDGEGGGGGIVAAPVFSRVAARALAP